MNVSFNTVLDPTRETPKAWKVFAGDYLPKSLVTAEVIQPVSMKAGKKVIVCQIATVTMPKWLAKR